MTRSRASLPTLLFPICVLLIIAWVWSSTLQRDIAAPDNEWLLGDSAEFVVAWHTWGISHPPGYPLLNFIANGLVRVATQLGTGPVLAASSVSYLSSLGAMLIFAAIILNHKSRPGLLSHKTNTTPSVYRYITQSKLIDGLPAAVVMLLLAFANMTWLFASAAEAYGFGLLLGWLCWRLAQRVRQQPSLKRLLLFAFAFGLAFGHHRTSALLLPALLYLIAPAYRILKWWAWPLALGMGLLSGIVYAYVPLAIALQTPFSYGTLPLNTWDGLLNLILTQERSNELPSEALTSLRIIPQLLTDRMLGLALEITWLGVAMGVIALLRCSFAVTPSIRSAGRALSILFVSYLLVPIGELLLFSTHLPVMLVSWGLALALALALTDLRNEQMQLHDAGAKDTKPVLLFGLTAVGTLLIAFTNYQQNWQPVRQLIHDPRGRQLIASIKSIPESNPTFVELWGPRYATLAYAKWVSKELDNILLFKVNEQLNTLPARDRLATVLYTTPKTMVRIPPGIWIRTFVLPVTLNSPVDGVIAIDHRYYERVPNRRTQIAQFEVEVDQAKAWFTPEGDVRLVIDWHAMQAIDTDYRVFIYLSDNPFAVQNDNDILARFEQSAPVYGFYPTSRWRNDLRVRDNYRVPLPTTLNRLPTRAYFGLATSVRGIIIPQLIRAVPIENTE